MPASTRADAPPADFTLQACSLLQISGLQPRVLGTLPSGEQVSILVEPGTKAGDTIFFQGSTYLIKDLLS